MIGWNSIGRAVLPPLIDPSFIRVSSLRTAGAHANILSASRKHCASMRSSVLTRLHRGSCSLLHLWCRCLRLEETAAARVGAPDQRLTFSSLRAYSLWFSLERLSMIRRLPRGEWP